MTASLRRRDPHSQRCSVSRYMRGLPLTLSSQELRVMRENGIFNPVELAGDTRFTTQSFKLEDLQSQAMMSTQHH